MQESIEAIRTELEERLRFETLLAELSARFVNLPADRIPRTALLLLSCAGPEDPDPFFPVSKGGRKRSVIMI
jgi:hypothetical protein